MLVKQPSPNYPVDKLINLKKSMCIQTHNFNQIQVNNFKKHGTNFSRKLAT
jgi:hypothetical protein